MHAVHIPATFDVPAVGSSSVDSASDDEGSHASSTPPRADVAIAPQSTFPSALAERWDDLAGDGGKQAC
jgi:hypothetical protein